MTTVMDGRTRHLVFTNLLNGVPADRVAEALRLSPEQVGLAFRFVRDKIRSYCFERRMPPPPDCETPEQARKSRLVLLNFLQDLNLDKEPRIKVQGDGERVDERNIREMFNIR